MSTLRLRKQRLAVDPQGMQGQIARTLWKARPRPLFKQACKDRKKPLWLSFVGPNALTRGEPVGQRNHSGEPARRGMVWTMVITDRALCLGPVAAEQMRGHVTAQQGVLVAVLCLGLGVPRL